MYRTGRQITYEGQEKTVCERSYRQQVIFSSGITSSTRRVLLSSEGWCIKELFSIPQTHGKIPVVLCWQILGSNSNFPFYIWTPCSLGLRPSFHAEKHPRIFSYLRSSFQKTHLLNRKDAVKTKYPATHSFHACHEFSPMFLCLRSRYRHKLKVQRPAVSTVTVLKDTTVMAVWHEDNI